MRPRYVLLAGGVGGAKLALGLARVLDPADLVIVANTGDDFEHLGLSLSPDLDTLMYTLAGLANPATGWGMAGDTGSFMAGLAALGAETWFHLGDRDLATHVERTRLLRAGQGLTDVTRHLCARLGVAVPILPMSDAPVRTRIETDDGMLDFQDYFVRHKAEPVVRALHYTGAATAPPDATLAALLTDPGLAAILIAPSNPWLSIAPLLAIPSLRAALRSATAPVVAVSPIVGGQALKGPTAKIMTELGLTPSATAVANFYREFIDGFVVDSVDAAEAEAIRRDGIATATTNTVMKDLADREALARFTLDFAGRCA